MGRGKSAKNRVNPAKSGFSILRLEPGGDPPVTGRGREGSTAHVRVAHVSAGEGGKQTFQKRRGTSRLPSRKLVWRQNCVSNDRQRVRWVCRQKRSVGGAYNAKKRKVLEENSTITSGTGGSGGSQPCRADLRPRCRRGIRREGKIGKEKERGSVTLREPEGERNRYTLPRGKKQATARAEKASKKQSPNRNRASLSELHHRTAKDAKAGATARKQNCTGAFSSKSKEEKEKMDGEKSRSLGRITIVQVTRSKRRIGKGEAVGGKDDGARVLKLNRGL